VAVHVYRWLPDDGDVTAVVQIAHGLVEHAGRYERVAQALTGAGYAVYANDHRGHGRTAKVMGETLGHFADERGWAKVLDDLHRLTAVARDEQPGAPLVLFGHSVGSFLTQQYLFTFPDAIDAAVLSGTSGPGGPELEVAAVVARVEQRRLGPRGRSAVLNTMFFGAYNKAFAPNRTDFDWLSRDPVEVDAYIDDPLCGEVATTRTFRDILAGGRVISDADRLDPIRRDLPVYVFSGERDPVGGADGVAALVDRYEHAGMTAVTSRVYPDARHEMLNETNRAEVTADLIAWIDATVAARRG
jgi:alpha-beta hydrolase superfamily lysophospholipase